MNRLNNSKISLLISSYNWKEALLPVLESVFSQSFLPCEIVIADDGSRDDTKALIDEQRKVSPIPIQHIWHEDRGFRLSAIRNRAIAACKGDYIVQIDGDCILHPDFIKDHSEMMEQNYFVCGSRVYLTPEYSKEILNGTKVSNCFLKHKRKLNAMRSPFIRNFLAKRYSKNNLGRLRGCNMAFWKVDLLKVNGYNEGLSSWGHEDSEIAFRLLNAGVKKKFLKMGGIQYHIYHKEASKESAAANYAEAIKTKEAGSSWTKDGLDKYLS